MTTRRDLLKVASALGLAGTVPTAAERIAAAQLLEQDASPRVMLNPAEFAEQIHHTVGNGFDRQFNDDWASVICPEEWAEYTQSYEALERLAPAIGVDLYHAVGDYGATSVSLALAFYDAGVRHGAAYENLRRALVGETVVCTSCFGSGVTRDDGVTCTTCGGTGTVAMREG